MSRAILTGPHAKKTNFKKDNNSTREKGLLLRIEDGVKTFFTPNNPSDSEDSPNSEYQQEENRGNLSYILPGTAKRTEQNSVSQEFTPSKNYISQGNTITEIGSTKTSPKSPPNSQKNFIHGGLLEGPRKGH